MVYQWGESLKIVEIVCKKQTQIIDENDLNVLNEYGIRDNFE